MNPVLDFIINQIFGQGAIFISLIAFVGLVLQKKNSSEIIRGTFMTAIGYFVLTQGSSMIQGAVTDVGTAFSAIMNSPAPGESVDIGGQYGTQIGIVMLIGFFVNLLVARFTKFKTVFLTGHMLYWFPFVFVAAGVDAGMKGVGLVIFAGIFTAIYMVVAPNLMLPLVKKVTGDGSFSLAHPTTPLSLIAAGVAKLVGDPSKSTEDIKFPKALNFCREVSIICSIVIFFTYVVMAILLGPNADAVLFNGTAPFVYFFNKTMTFGAGVTVLLLGVRMLIAEIVPAFTGFSEKLVPGAIPALDCPTLFPYGPNANVLGFLCSLVGSIVAILIFNPMGIFPGVVVPLAFTCFFEAGTAAIIANAYGGVRGCVIASFINGIVMVLLVGFGGYFFSNTIQNWMLVFGGNDFDLWGIIAGLFAKLFA